MSYSTDEKQPATAAPEGASTPKDEIVTTRHTITVQGQELRYLATAGKLVMKNEQGKAKASIFFVAYTKEGVDDVGQRPLTISFNGGPGSSSVWLHLGLLGPRRVLSGDVNAIQPPPYRLIDNEYTLLAETDLVFIDPVSTGYSRAVAGEEAKQFHGLEKDIESVGDFIRLYVTRYKRWRSPKFLIGESYGTTRAVGLSGYLQNRHGLYLNGLMLISVVLDFQTLLFVLGNDLPFLLYLPTYAATAWYHQRAGQGKTLRTFMNEVEHFAFHEYAVALLRGDQLAGEQRAAIVAKLADYTGLSADYLERTNLRVEIFRFARELLRAEQHTVGRLDSRFTGSERDAAGEHLETDPSYSAIQGSYSSTFNAYVREELNFESDLPYEVLTGLYDTWDYSKHQNQFVTVADTLRAAMTQNPALRVLVANGYYDLATPYFATEYTFNHLQLPPALRANITRTYYEAGHMMYVHEPSLAQLHEDLVAFVQATFMA